VLWLYRSLLYLYPPAYRLEYGEEMMAVLCEVHERVRAEGILARMASGMRECGGLFRGAFQEQFRAIVHADDCSLFSSRGRYTMHSEFRFPKTAVMLMTVILVAILVAIDKAKSIQASVPYANPHIGPIQSVEFTLVPTLLIVLAGACITGVVSWAILFALRRSGVHRMSAFNPSGTPRVKS
jgi:hypothetical protein